MTQNPRPQNADRARPADSSALRQNNIPHPAVVDAVIPVFGEREVALAMTLEACLTQTHRFARIFVVDDGSPRPVIIPEGLQSSGQVTLLRLSENQGISAARNAAISRSDVPWLACINVEVLPEPEWVEICLSYMSNHAEVGACYTRVLPMDPGRLLTRWRMRFQEPAYPEKSGPTAFAHGHAVLFRREAINAVGGYDIRFRRHHEDSDISRRMRAAGWESHFVPASRCVSIQADTVQGLAAKQLRDSGWYSPAESSLLRLYLDLSKWTMVRAGRNLLKARLHFLPVDVAIWASALWMATFRTIFHRQSASKRFLETQQKIGPARPRK